MLAALCAMFTHVICNSRHKFKTIEFFNAKIELLLMFLIKHLTANSVTSAQKENIKVKDYFQDLFSIKFKYCLVGCLFSSTSIAFENVYEKNCSSLHGMCLSYHVSGSFICECLNLTIKTPEQHH